MAAAPDFLSPEHTQPPLSVHTPGPLSLSQLDTSHSVARRGKLEPLPIPKERKARRKTKSKATDPQDSAQSTVGRENGSERIPVSSDIVSSPTEDSLVSIRARLDPFYQTQTAVALEPEQVLPTAMETGSETVAEPKKKKRRRRMKETDEEAPPQEVSTFVAVNADLEPPASRTAPLPRDDPQADGESSPTLSEGIVTGSQEISEPITKLRPKKRKKREPRPKQPGAGLHQSAPPPVVFSPSPSPPRDVHVTVSTIPVQFDPPSVIEPRQRAAHSCTPTSEQSLGESYCRPQSESPLVGGSRTSQVFQGSPTSPEEDAPHEQETGMMNIIHSTTPTYKPLQHT